MWITITFLFHVIMNMLSIQPTKRRGFSLIEILLVIGIIAVLALAAFLIYPRVENSYKVKKEIDNLSFIQANMRALGVKNSNYADAIPPNTATATLNSARVFPTSMNGGVYTGSDIKNSWGGTVTLNATANAHAGFRAGQLFTINYLSVPTKACIDLVTGAATKFKVIHVYANGSSTSASRVYPDSVNVNEVISFCSQSNDIRLQFLSD